MRERTARVNALRGLGLYEFGVVKSKGTAAGSLRWLADNRAQIDGDCRADAALGAAATRHAAPAREHIEVLEAEVKEMVEHQQAGDLAPDQRFRAWMLPQCQRGGQSWATHRDGATHASSPAAWGWAQPRRHRRQGAHGTHQQRGDAYLRTLLIHGARNLVRTALPSQWIARMTRCVDRSTSGTAVALDWPASWAMAAHGREYDPNWLSKRHAKAASTAAA